MTIFSFMALILSELAGGGGRAKDLRRKSRIEASDLGPHLGEAGLELVGGDVVTLFNALADGVGDDLGLVASNATGGELLSDGERVEHASSLPRGRRIRPVFGLRG